MAKDSRTGPAATRSGPRLEAASLGEGSAFLRAAGLILDEITAARVAGHLVLGREHHTPWGIVHGGVYTTAIESAADITDESGRLIAHGEVRLQNVAGT